MKLQSPDQRIQGAIAWYDLKRQNVVVNDSVNPNEKVQRGEQLTRGIETELSAVILEGLKLTAAYTYTIDAEISKDANASNVGKRSTIFLNTLIACQLVTNLILPQNLVGISAVDSEVKPIKLWIS